MKNISYPSSCLLKVKKAVVLTAGMGTRMLPLTAALPKALLPVGLKPAVQIVAEEAINAGIKELCIVTSPNTAVKKHFEYLVKINPIFFGIDIYFAVQQEPRGSGDALVEARDFCGGDNFLLLNCDDLFECNACKILLDNFCGHSLVGAASVDKLSSVNFGVIISSDSNNVSCIKEKPMFCEVCDNPVVSAGRYLLTSQIFNALETAPYVCGELRLTEALNLLASQSALSFVTINCRRFDTGSPCGYTQAFLFFAKFQNLDIKQI